MAWNRAFGYLGGVYWALTFFTVPAKDKNASWIIWT
jgi:hypothetical protein